MKITQIPLLIATSLALYAPVQAADVSIPTSPGAWQGFMSVFNLGPGNTAGSYVFGQGWGVADLRASPAAGTLLLQANTNGYEDNANAFWRSNNGTGPLGNKFMDAAIFVPSNGLIGQDITFSFNVDAFSFSEHTVTAFIRMFSADFAVLSEVTQPVTGTGAYSIFAPASQTGAIGVANIQYGFNTKGINSSLANVASYGSASMSAIPEPSQVAMLGLGAGVIAFILRRRRQV